MRPPMTLSLAALALCAAPAWADNSAKSVDPVVTPPAETAVEASSAEGPLFITGDADLPPLLILPSPGQALEGFADFFATQGHSPAAVDALRAASKALAFPSIGLPLGDATVDVLPPADDTPGPWATFFPGAIFNLLSRVPESAGPAPVEGEVEEGTDLPEDEVSPTEDAQTFIQRRRQVGGIRR